MEEINTNVATEQVETTLPTTTTEQSETTSTEATEASQAGTVVPPELAGNQQYQAAIKGMNEAQRKAADLQKQVERLGQIDQYFEQVRNIAQYQGQDAALQLLAQELGFTNVQQMQQATQTQEQHSELDELYKDDPIYQKLKALEAKDQQRDQFFQQQNNAQLVQQAEAKMNSALELLPGIDQTAVWNVMAEAALPPQFADLAVVGAALASAGGIKPWMEKIGADAVAKHIEQVKQSNQAASTTIASPSSVQAVQTQNLNDLNLNDMWDSINQSARQRAEQSNNSFG
jgi:hypothetical protein